ncbi:MAG: chromate efflux transporter [Bdellovibrionota bacterium]
MVSLAGLARYFLWLGATGFGGPVVLCEHMRRDLVESRGWISPQEYLEGFSLSQLAPGPLAAQLAIYLGWVRAGVFGATLAGVAFILPSFLMVLALSVFYVTYGGLSWIQGAFYGIGSAVIAIMAQSSYKLVTKTFRRDWLLWAIGLSSAAVTVITETEWLLLFLLGGILVAIARHLPRRNLAILLPPVLMTGIHGVGSNALLLKIFLFFAKAGALVFGSGLAIVPFLHGGVVLENHWLGERQFLDSVAVAMITPGPVVITVAFIGYLVSGSLGAAAAALGVFLPCYLFVIIPAPFYSRFSKSITMRGFVDGVTAAAVGAIAGATFVLGRRALIDWVSILFFVLALAALLKLKRVPEPVLILIAGIVGILVKSH